MNRPTSLLLVGVAAAGLLAGCGDDDAGASDAAATVNGTTISNQDLVDELEAIEGNELYLTALEGQRSSQGLGPAVVADGEFDTAFTTDALSVRIQYALVAEEVEARGLVADEACVEQATGQLAAGYAGATEDGDGQSVLDAFPEDYRQYLIDRQTDLLLLTADLAGTECGAEPTDDEVAAYLEANPAAGVGSACVSHILVDTPEEAAEVQGLLDGGADFATIASERSTDTGSGAEGGELGCGPPGQFVEPFALAVATQPIGEVGEPVETEFGHHLVLVTERTPLPEDELGAAVQTAMQEGNQAAFLEWFNGALEEGEVTVDSRFGTWDQVNASITAPAVEVTDSGEG